MACAALIAASRSRTCLAIFANGGGNITQACYLARPDLELVTELAPCVRLVVASKF